MLRPLSYDLLAAQTEAWPLASEEAFAACVTRLAEVQVGRRSPETQALADALEGFLRPRTPGLSLEVLTRICDEAWFGSIPRSPGGHREVPLGRFLAVLANRYLEPHGGRLCLKHDAGVGSAARAMRWRWLTLRLPEDLLVAALAAERREAPQGEQVTLLTPVLARVLGEHEVAETHLHVGAAVGFPRLWTALVAALAEEGVRPEDLEQGGKPPFGSGTAYLGRLYEAATARLVMASFLQAASPEDGLSFSCFCGGAPEDGAIATGGRSRNLVAIAMALGWPQGWQEGYRDLRDSMFSLAGQAGRHPGWSGDAASPDRGLWSPERLRLDRQRLLYRRLAHGRRGGGEWPRHDDVALQDPLAQWRGQGAASALPETSFAACALRYLLGRPGGDPWFEAVFWQYQRVRCLTFRHLVEEPGTGGLDWFSRHYRRISALRTRLDPAIYRYALESEAAGVRLAALEVRTAPPANWHEVCLEVRNLADQANSFQRRRDRGEAQGVPGEGPEVALLFHFIKSRGDTLAPEVRGLPWGHPRICRYGRWYFRQLRGAYAVAEALRRVPEILLVLRGLDVANTELAIPTWATLPLFRLVRQASAEAAERLASTRRGWAVSRLRVTSHLGEEFARLPQGLRRMHEPIEFGLFEAGSRIGHGVALGVDPERWALESSTVSQTAQERLEDLLWELQRYGCGDLPAEIGRLEQVRHEAQRLARFIFDASPDLYDLQEGRARLHTQWQLDQIQFPFVHRPEQKLYGGQDRVFDEIIWPYLIDPDVYDRGERQIEVQTTPGETAFLIAAQRWLRRVLGRLEITIESNPSSNLLIGSFESLDDHPAFRLLPLPSRRRPEDSPVMLSISTDDPTTFASRLADEYAHIYFALTRNQVPSEEALSWLDEVRRHGWRSRFSLEASRRPENLEAACKPFQPAWKSGRNPRLG
jgi:Adenosine deaminase